MVMLGAKSSSMSCVKGEWSHFWTHYVIRPHTVRLNGPLLVSYVTFVAETPLLKCFVIIIPNKGTVPHKH